jgi:hypothetical protein
MFNTFPVRMDKHSHQKGLHRRTWQVSFLRSTEIVTPSVKRPRPENPPRRSHLSLDAGATGLDHRVTPPFPVQPPSLSYSTLNSVQGLIHPCSPEDRAPAIMPWARFGLYLCWVRSTLRNLKFDVCDPERHFALTIPRCARSCPPLLNAIFTAAARYLSRLEKYKSSHGIEY